LLCCLLNNKKDWISDFISNGKLVFFKKQLMKFIINAIGAVAVLENAPYTILREGFGRRAGGESYDWARKNKHRIFLNLETETKDVSLRVKIASRFRLVNWLKARGAEGERIIKTWGLEN
jgi:hypothetical protein